MQFLVKHPEHDFQPRLAESFVLRIRGIFWGLPRPTIHNNSQQFTTIHYQRQQNSNSSLLSRLHQGSLASPRLASPRLRDHRSPVEINLKGVNLPLLPPVLPPDRFLDVDLEDGVRPDCSARYSREDVAPRSVPTVH